MHQDKRKISQNGCSHGNNLENDQFHDL